MSFKLIGVLIALMVVNQIIGTGYGTWKEGFNKQVFWKGVTKVLYLLLGYGVIALTINLAAEFVAFCARQRPLVRCPAAVERRRAAVKRSLAAGKN